MSRPNILVFFTDQQRADTIGALGNAVIRTPALDRLCAEGTAFTRAYSPSPVCVPARCALHYGQYPQQTGCYSNGTPMPTDGRPSFMQALADAGYRTHGIGKCHFTPDGLALRGFQTRETQEEGVWDPSQDDYMTYLRANGFAHLTDPHGVRSEMYYIPQPAQMPAALHPTQWIGDRATAFIGEQPADQPWMLFCSFIHPHPPFAVPAPWHKLYRAPDMPLPHLPEDAASLLLAINRIQNRYKYRDRGTDLNLLRCMKAYYYAAISFIDYQIGRVLAALEARGQLDNTLMLHTADHGELLGDFGCVGKRSMHEACLRVPLIARFPARFAAGARCERPVSLVDVMPTVLGAAGVSTDGLALDGIDLADAPTSPRDAVIAQFDQGERAVYTLVEPEWKYTFSAPDQAEWLLPGGMPETRNLAGDPAHAATLARMRRRLIADLRESGETDALDGDAWRAYPTFAMPDDPDAGLLYQDARWADTTIPGYGGGPVEQLRPLAPV